MNAAPRSVRFHPDAAAELSSAAVFYGTKAEGLDRRLLDEVEAALALLALQPLLGAVLVGDTRRWSIRVFPYTIAYRATDRELFVLAIAHQRRRPRYWRRRA